MLHTNDRQTDDADADDADVESEFDEEDEEGGQGRSNNSISSLAAKKMKKYLELEDTANNSSKGDAGRYQKLLDMDFMKKATDRLSEKAKLEAQQALLELQQMEAESDEFAAAQDDDDRHLSAHERALRDEARQKELQEREIKMREARLAVDGLLGASGVFGGSSGSGMLMPKKKTAATSAWSAFLPTVPDAEAQSNEQEDISENPWLQKPISASGRTGSGGGGKMKASGADNAQIYVQIDSLLQQTGKRKGEGNKPSESEHQETSKAFEGKAAKKTKKGTEKTTEPAQTASPVASTTAPSANNNKKERKAVLLPKSQAELVQQAFAAPDLESDFAQLKATAVERELGIAENERKALSTGEKTFNIT